jgi:hypothetical protein
MYAIHLKDLFFLIIKNNNFNYKFTISYSESRMFITEIKVYILDETQSEFLIEESLQDYFIYDLEQFEKLYFRIRVLSNKSFKCYYFFDTGNVAERRFIELKTNSFHLMSKVFLINRDHKLSSFYEKLPFQSKIELANILHNISK